MTRILDSLSEVAPHYDALFCDLWGCVHDGLRAYPEAIAALRAFRAGGGAVVLVTNAPRARAEVEAHLVELGVPADAYDAVATSGDAARAAMFTGAVGNKVWFMGEERDRSFFAPMQIIEDPAPIEVVELEEAEGIVCCGPFDPHAPVEDLRPQLLYAKQKGLPLLCANPDIVVDLGDTREFCAGAVAALYTEMGGESLYFGKPHPPIYDLARRRLAALGKLPVDETRILAVGDGISTDVAGALGEGVGSLFITGGLAAEETKTDRQPEAEALTSFFEGHQMSADYAIGFLR